MILYFTILGSLATIMFVLWVTSFFGTTHIKEGEFVEYADSRRQVLATYDTPKGRKLKLYGYPHWVWESDINV